MKIPIAVFIIVTSVVVMSVLGSIVVVKYNGIITSEKVVEESKAHIDAVCQRRLDLIPNLVEIVKGYASHEQVTLVAVTAARGNAQELLDNISKKQSFSKEDVIALSASQTAISGALKSVFTLAENYPKLRASTNFLSLQDQMEGSENRINIARQRYNRSIKDYYTNIATFPGNIVSFMFGFEDKAYYEAESDANKGIKITF